MYRGDVLAGAGDGEWVAPHRARLEEARMKLVETQCTARLRLGDVGDVIGELEAAVATLPVPGEPVGAADHRAVPGRAPGRRAGRRTSGSASRLADELGLDPGPAAAATRAADPASTTRPLAAAARTGEPRSSRTRRPGTCRRCRPSSSVATREMAALSRAARRRAGWSRSSGPGGIGKTGARDRGRPRACRPARWRVVGPARDGDDGRRRHRHGDRGGERHRRRGGPARTAPRAPTRW